MYNIIVRVFDHLKITSPMKMDKRLAYTQRILRGFAVKKSSEVLVTWTKLSKELAGDEWTLGDMTRLAAE